MKKLLLSVCVAAVAFWASDVGAMKRAMKYAITESEYQMETEGHREVCEARELGTSEEDFALLKNCAEFPRLEQIEIEDENAWIFRRPKFEDLDSFLFRAGMVISDDPQPAVMRILATPEEGEPILRNRIKSFPKLKKIIGRESHLDIDYDDYSLYNPFNGYGEPYADCSMSRILQDITTLRTLEEISLNGWNLACVRLPREIENLQNLRVLSIVGSGLYQLPESIGNLRNLQRLELRNEHNLASLPESIGNLENLQSLNLSGTYIKSFPESIKNLGKLKTLDLRNCSNLESRPFYFIMVGIDTTLKNLPDFIWKMPALEKVMIDEELEESIPFEKLREIIVELTLAGRNHKRWSDNQLRKVVKLHTFPSNN